MGAFLPCSISPSRSLGIGVLAEGVETSAQRDFLLKHRRNHIQGYYYSHPLDPLALWEFVEQHGDPAS